jgi:hypothetical protein
MKITVEANTQPITPNAVGSKDFSFASGGGGGGGGGSTNITALNVNAGGGNGNVPVAIPAGSEVQVGHKLFGFVGLKQALYMESFATSALVPVGVSYKARLYVNGVMVNEVPLTTLQAFCYAVVLPTTAGQQDVALKIFNDGANDISVTNYSVGIAEFL